MAAAADDDETRPTIGMPPPATARTRAQRARRSGAQEAGAHQQGHRYHNDNREPRRTWTPKRPPRGTGAAHRPATKGAHIAPTTKGAHTAPAMKGAHTTKAASITVAAPATVAFGMVLLTCALATVGTTVHTPVNAVLPTRRGWPGGAPVRATFELGKPEKNRRRPGRRRPTPQAGRVAPAPTTQVGQHVLAAAPTTQIGQRVLAAAPTIGWPVGWPKGWPNGWPKGWPKECPKEWAGWPMGTQWGQAPAKRRKWRHTRPRGARHSAALIRSGHPRLRRSSGATATVCGAHWSGRPMSAALIRSGRHWLRRSSGAAATVCGAGRSCLRRSRPPPSAAAPVCGAR